MKKIIGYICIAIALLNVVGFIYLTISNPDKLSGNSDYFIKKIVFALVIGGLGIWLMQSSNKNNNDNLPSEQ